MREQLLGWWARQAADVAEAGNFVEADVGSKNPQNPGRLQLQDIVVGDIEKETYAGRTLSFWNFSLSL